MNPNVTNTHAIYMTHVQTQPKKIRIKKDNQQQSKRTREQEVNDKHILIQQMTGLRENLIRSE